NDSLKKVSISGGPPVPLARVEDLGRGGSWGTDGNIAFAPGFLSGLSLVSATGGTVQTLTTLDRQKAETSHRFPHYLPGGGARLLEVRGSPMPLVQGILPSTNFTGATQAAFADTGLLVYVPGSGKVLDRTVVWVDRNGTEQPVPLPPRGYRHPRLSPDERHLL